MPLVDRVVQRIAARQPTVLVVDDLQWADVSSLDMLAYLIAGFRGQNLALVVTIREEDRPVGHPLHGWLADVRRLPGVSEMMLARLDSDEATQQIAALLGRPPGEELVADVLKRSGGNAYFTELLVHDLPPDAVRLSDALPHALREALLARWHSLSEPARLLAQLLAVGGRPATYATLGAVSDGVVPIGDLPAVLREAVEGGVAQVVGDDTYWFRHPLLAEVLAGTLTKQELAPVHAAYAEALEASVAVRPDLAGPLSADLAVHHEAAGHLDQAFAFSIRAADYAHELHASTMEAAQLMRACALWEGVSEGARGSTDDQIALLLRTSQVGEQAGVLENTEILDRALSLVDPQRQPLLTSTLLAERGNNAWLHDPANTHVRPELLEAVRLTEPFPESAERAVALAHLVAAELWQQWDLRSREMPAHILAHVGEAVEVAERCGSAAALARALYCRGRYLCDDHQSSEGLADVEAAYLLARKTGHVATMEMAAIWQVNALLDLGRIVEVAQLGKTVVKELFAAGSTQWGCFVAAMAAEALLELGRWPECDDLLRQALSASRIGIAGANVRQAAASLAARRGESAVAQQHMDRALELVSIDFVGLDMHSTLVELLVGRGDPEQALELIQPVLKERLALLVDRDADYVLLWAARTAADVAEAARDRREVETEQKATHLLDELVAIAETTPLARHGLSVEADPVWSAYRATTSAETERCHGSAGQAAAWERAAGKHRDIGFRWFEAMACWRQAQALLSEGAARSMVAERLRLAHAIAVNLGAQPLVAETESLARAARISLAEPGGPVEPSKQQSVLAALTSREREVLGHLVAGRTNAEIARDLFISDKTVSVHVTNVLRKTGTANRVEAASLARRLELRRSPSPGDRGPQATAASRFRLLQSGPTGNLDPWTTNEGT